MVNIKTVAAAAGVSVATVSRALSGQPSVAPELVARVEQAVRALGYRPNAIARSLRTSTTNTIALIIPDISNPFFTAVARGVEDVAAKEGLSVLLCNTDEDPDKERRYLEVAEETRAAGVVLSPHDKSSDVSRFHRNGVPVTVIDRPIADHSCDTVFADSFNGARDATNHLLEEGWDRPACITGPRSATTARSRARGYLAALRRHAHPDQYLTYADFRVAGGRRAASDLLDQDRPPDSFMIGNAMMTLGVLAELTERGLVVGEDVGVVTFDDAPWAPYLNPPITVVAQPAYEIGGTATKLLLDTIQGAEPRSPRQIKLRCQLVVRRSSLRG